MCFGGGPSSPKVAPAPKPPPPPKPPPKAAKPVEDEVVKGREEAKARALKLQGMAGTNKTGALGLEEEAAIKKKSILGG